VKLLKTTYRFSYRKNCPVVDLKKAYQRQGIVTWRIRLTSLMVIEPIDVHSEESPAIDNRACDFVFDPASGPGLSADEHAHSGRILDIGALVVSYFCSAQFLALAPATQQTYRLILEKFRNEHGDKPVALLTREHVKAMLAQKGTTRAAANHWLRLVKALMAFAVEEKWRKDDPTTGIKRIKNKSDGFHTWDESEIAQFEARHPIGGMARLAFALLLFTAQRRSDVVRMGRQHVRKDVVHVRQQKTGAMLAIPLHPALAVIIAATPSDHLTFLTTSFGKSFTAPGFGNWFRERCNEAGLPRHCAAHGLRKAACRRLAEAGCSANVIASISGHTTLNEVARYTKAADQERMAREGMAAISGTASGNGDKLVANSGKKS
jgi:integrase